MGVGDSLWKWPNFRLSRARDLDLGSSHTAHCHASLIDLYLHTKLYWNWRNVFWTDRRTFETHFIRSTQRNQPNNNNRDDIYGAVIMAKPLREFTRFIWWMQTQRRGGRQPSDQANRLRLRVCQKEMAAIIHIHHHHLLLLSPRADTHFTVPRKLKGWVDLGTAVRVCSPCPRLYMSQWLSW